MNVLKNHRKDSSGCWIWLGTINPTNGYGTHYFKRNGKATSTSAHRAVWTKLHGEPPRHIQVCHTCDVRLCVRPKHLFLGTGKENCIDRSRKGRSARQHFTERQAVEVFLSPLHGGRAAKQFGVDPDLIRKIRQRKLYAWATEGLVPSAREHHCIDKGRLTKLVVQSIFTSPLSGVAAAKKFKASTPEVAQIRSGKRYAYYTVGLVRGTRGNRKLLSAAA